MIAKINVLADTQYREDYKLSRELRMVKNSIAKLGVHNKLRWEVYILNIIRSTLSQVSFSKPLAC